MVILSEREQQVIESLYKQMYKRLFSYAFSIFRDKPLAEEAVQDTFQIACLKVASLETSPNPKGWLMKTLKYVMNNIRQRQTTREAFVVSDREFDENIAATPQQMSIETEVSFMDVLGEADYKMLKRVVLKQATIHEAALELDISDEACSKRIQRSKAKLRKIFQKNEN